MLLKVLETIKENNMIKAGDKVVCALSGGADSVALLYALYELKDEVGVSLYAANLNHLIRGAEAEGDSEFCKQLCDRLGIEIFMEEADIPRLSKEKGISEEVCGRCERYAFFERVSDTLSGALIATGHHMNDNAETVLFNLLRGSSGKGLSGIPCKRGNIIRPLIGVTREEIEEFLTNRQIEWRTDSSNKDLKYSRNVIRNVILKDMRDYFPSAVKKINSASKMLGEDDDFLTEMAREAGCIENNAIICERFNPLHPSIKRRVAKLFLEQSGVCDIDFEKIDAVCRIASGATGKKRDIGKNKIVVNNYSVVTVEENSPQKEEMKWQIKVGENVEISDFEGVWRVKVVDKREKMRDNKMMILLDADKMNESVTIRHRTDGDFMYPMGMEGRKKIKKIFIDLKIPTKKRDNILLLADGSEVLFIPGIRKTAKYATDENTEKFFVAQYIKN